MYKWIYHIYSGEICYNFHIWHIWHKAAGRLAIFFLSSSELSLYELSIILTALILLKRPPGFAHKMDM